MEAEGFVLIVVVVWLIGGFSVLIKSSIEKPESPATTPSKSPENDNRTYVQWKFDTCTEVYMEALVAIDGSLLSEEERELARKSAKRRYLTSIRDLVGNG